MSNRNFQSFQVDCFVLNRFCKFLRLFFCGVDALDISHLAFFREVNIFLFEIKERKMIDDYKKTIWEIRWTMMKEMLWSEWDVVNTKSIEWTTLSKSLSSEQLLHDFILVMVIQVCASDDPLAE